MLVHLRSADKRCVLGTPANSYVQIVPRRTVGNSILRSLRKMVVTASFAVFFIFLSLASVCRFADAQEQDQIDDAKGSFVTFDVTGAGTGQYQGTYGLGINTAGTIAGYYIDSKNAYHGFVRTASGEFTKFDAPGAGKEAFDGTYAYSINDAGDITGWVESDSGKNFGFVRSAAGKITTFEAPGAGQGYFSGHGRPAIWVVHREQQRRDRRLLRR